MIGDPDRGSRDDRGAGAGEKRGKDERESLKKKREKEETVRERGEEIESIKVCSEMEGEREKDQRETPSLSLWDRDGDRKGGRERMSWNLTIN